MGIYLYLLLHCMLSLVAQCIVIGPVCLCVGLWACVFVCGSVTTITRNCVGSVGESDDRLQLIKFWLSCIPGKGSAAGQKNLAPTYYSQSTVFASFWALFHSLWFWFLFDWLTLSLYIFTSCVIIPCVLLILQFSNVSLLLLLYLVTFCLCFFVSVHNTVYIHYILSRFSCLFHDQKLMYPHQTGPILRGGDPASPIFGHFLLMLYGFTYSNQIWHGMTSGGRVCF